MAVVQDSDAVISSFTSAPARVVTLVPSITDSLLAFGLEKTLIGVTDYCQIPGELEHSLVRVGGTKTPDVPLIIKLNPDLVIANQEENDRKVVESLIAADLDVWVTFPVTVEEAIQDLRDLVRIFKVERSAAAQLETLERISEWARLANVDRIRPKYFCPIWQSDDDRRWMTFNAETYANDVLAYSGGENVFADKGREVKESEGEGGDSAGGAGVDTRYPWVSLDEVVLKKPEVVLLPDEPYHFGEGHLSKLQELLAGTPAVDSEAIYLLDGRLITWHGVRMAQAFAELPRYFQ
jgi:iron complex transport system substrate-binding protein